MNTQQLLEQLLKASKGIAEKGKDIAEKGKNIAEDTLNIPKEGPEREEVLSNLKKGTAIAAVAAVLLGTKGGRTFTKTAVKVGGIAAIGGVAFKAYKNWKGNAASGTPINELEHSDAEERSLLLLQAMVAAANADGHIDEQEQAVIKQEILNMHLPEALLATIEEIVQNPLGAEELAKQVSTDAEASEVYLTSRLFIDNNSDEKEKSYLQALISALNLAPELVTELNNGVNLDSTV